MVSYRAKIYENYDKKNPSYPEIMNDYKLSYYDLSNMKKDREGVFVGTYSRVTKEHQGILKDPESVLRDALRLYTLNAIYFASGYSYESYDNLRGWASNVNDDYPPYTPLTNTQVENLKKTFSKRDKVFRNQEWKSSLSGIYLMTDFPDRTLKELEEIWDVGKGPESVGALLRSSLSFLDSLAYQEKSTYLGIYSKERVPPECVCYLKLFPNVNPSELN